MFEQAKQYIVTNKAKMIRVGAAVAGAVIGAVVAGAISGSDEDLLLEDGMTVEEFQAEQE